MNSDLRRRGARRARMLAFVSACALLATPILAQASSCHFYINSDGTVQVGFPQTAALPGVVACDISGITRAAIGVYRVTVRNGYSNGEYRTTLCDATVSHSGSGSASVKLWPEPKPSPAGVEGDQAVWTVRTAGAALGLLQTAVDRDFLFSCQSR
ncbi:hypothetical protein [Lysobacter sp. CA199]|uniref:hypothetical protein n=1 Tax=Lysobacter sp. CA199 TaxID=3455608 RepID=UPI003F8D0209